MPLTLYMLCATLVEPVGILPRAMYHLSGLGITQQWLKFHVHLVLVILAGKPVVVHTAQADLASCK